MKNFVRVLLPSGLVLAALLVPSRDAEAGIYCSSYGYTVCNRYSCCTVTCVYCEDRDTGELLSEICNATDCWDRMI